MFNKIIALMLSLGFTILAALAVSGVARMETAGTPERFLALAFVFMTVLMIERTISVFKVVQTKPARNFQVVRFDVQPTRITTTAAINAVRETVRREIRSSNELHHRLEILQMLEDSVNHVEINILARTLNTAIDDALNPPYPNPWERLQKASQSPDLHTRKAATWLAYAVEKKVEREIFLLDLDTFTFEVLKMKEHLQEIENRESQRGMAK